MSYLKHSEVISSLIPKFENAKSSGTLVFYPSTRSRYVEHGIDFEVNTLWENLVSSSTKCPNQRQICDKFGNTCPAIQENPVPQPPDPTKADKPDPFMPPYEADLYIGDIKDESDGDVYTIIVHFQSQSAPLSPSDLTQAYLLIRAAQASPNPIFAFYNCGANSGASQPHKHIQFIPTKDPVVAIEYKDEEIPRPPIEAYIHSLKVNNDTKLFSLPLPYVHLVHKLELPSASSLGTEKLSRQALKELTQTLINSSVALIDKALHAIQSYHNTQSISLNDDTAQVPPPSYNVLITSNYMHLIPRLRVETMEELAIELHPAGPENGKIFQVERDQAYYVPQRLSFNSLAFAGMLLAESDAQRHAIKRRGAMDLLVQVGLPTGGKEAEEIAS